MTPETFEQLVADVSGDAVPAQFHHLLTNVVFLIEDEPDEVTRQENGLHDPHETLLGLYKGIPTTERGDLYGVGVVLPDTITLYQKPIEQAALEDGVEVAQVIKETIWHEVAHHFGMDEEEVRKREEERYNL